MKLYDKYNITLYLNTVLQYINYIIKFYIYIRILLYLFILFFKKNSVFLYFKMIKTSKLFLF